MKKEDNFLIGMYFFDVAKDGKPAEILYTNKDETLYLCRYLFSSIPEQSTYVVKDIDFLKNRILFGDEIPMKENWDAFGKIISKEIKNE